MAKDAIDLSKFGEGVKVYLKMNPIDKILKDKGIDPAGDVQAFHTQNVLRRIIKFMPYRTGATIKVTIAGTNVREPRIVTDVPFGKYLYYGKAMAGGPPKKATGKDLQYIKDKNPQAGPYWDRALVAAESAKLQSELQAYIKRRKRP